MKPTIAAVLASITALGLLSACGGDTKLTIPASTTVTTEITLPDGITIPAGVSIPTDFSIPQQAIDQMLAQMEAAGMKIDTTCFAALLQDDSLRKLVAAGGTPTPEVIQKFVSCIKA